MAPTWHTLRILFIAPWNSEHRQTGNATTNTTHTQQCSFGVHHVSPEPISELNQMLSSWRNQLRASAARPVSTSNAQRQVFDNQLVNAPPRHLGRAVRSATRLTGHHRFTKLWQFVRNWASSTDCRCQPLTPLGQTRGQGNILGFTVTGCPVVWVHSSFVCSLVDPRD